jgi:hypothetical protein
LPTHLHNGRSSTTPISPTKLISFFFNYQW